MKSIEIRQKFFDFFKRHGHTIVPSSSLIPAQDPTLLFANAGMNQFKDVFLGKEQRSYKRAASIQKCMRAGGKHNDLENVGFTKRHLTFFEMMGNFSFGDYFKKEAIQFAWDFITKDLGIEKENLYATVYKKDDEAYTIWHTQIGLPENHIYRLGESDNFWQMGETGPCGPCSEIYIDRGASFGCKTANCAPGCNCDRFLEFWNLVFMQYDRQPDGTDKPLKQVGVDTGMGLERLCAILQDKDSVFQTDLFMPIINRTEQLVNMVYEQQDDTMKAAFHVLADHVRAATFLIADGCSPSNEGRGYVLRKVIRRAALFAKKLTQENIFPQLAAVVIDMMSEIYPELKSNQKNIISLLTSEIEKFSLNLVQGQELLEKYIEQHKNQKIISGQQAFKLYDTYGFPLELTKVIAQEKGFSVDVQEFEQYMEKQREQSGKKMAATTQIDLPENIVTTFTGYNATETASKIIGLLHFDHSVQHVGMGEDCWVIAQESPFYVECGGQISDKCWIIFEKNNQCPVLELKKINGAIAAKIHTPIEIAVGQTITQIVDKEARLNTMKNHTATHLLQAALIQLLGKNVKQAGSLVVPDYLRFDFTYHENLTSDQITQVEQVVNAKIMQNIPLQIEQTTYKDAIERGVIAFFGEKYNPEKVRVVQIPGFSAELCGGTHVAATGDIGCFKITEISALSAGQRRIVAVTGPKAVELFQQIYATVKKLTQEYKVQPQEIISAIQKQKEQLKAEQTLIKKLRKQQLQMLIPQWIELVHEITIKGEKIPFVCLLLTDFSAEELKEIVQQLLQRKSGFYIAINNDEQASSIYAELSPMFAEFVHIKQLSSWLKEQYQIRSGGKELTLQGGGPKIEQKFVQELTKWLTK